MQIGISGAHGFLGSHVCALSKRLYDVKTFDRHIHDLFDIASMKDFVEDVDVIYHLAGANRATNEELIRINTLGTLNLLDAVRKYARNDVRVILASSLQVYGLSRTLRYFTEDEVPHPYNTYGFSKLFAEEAMDAYREHHGIRGLVFRISNVYGPGCKPYYNSAIATFIDLMLNGKQISINGNGEQTRDFIYVSDVVGALSRSLEYHFKHGDTFNICTGVPVTINEVIHTLTRIFRASPSVEYKNAEGGVNYLVGDPSRFFNNMGHMSFVNLITGLSKTVNQTRRYQCSQQP